MITSPRVGRVWLENKFLSKKIAWKTKVSDFGWGCDRQSSQDLEISKMDNQTIVFSIDQIKPFQI
jgi:hypothetical protein